MCLKPWQPLLLIASLVLATSAQAKIYETTLENGLRVVVKEDKRAPVVTSQIWYNVGSKDEVNGHTGLSHMLEHMMFKGTDKYPDGEFSKVIANLGGIDNAATSDDFTFYYQEMAKEHLAKSFELEADRMLNLQFKEEDFAKELQVVKEERRWRTDDSPESLAYERLNAAAYIANPYKNPVIGWMHDLDGLTLHDAKAWYKKYYAPNNATLVVVGDIEHDAVFGLAKEYFADLPTSTIDTPKPQSKLPFLGKKTITVNLQAKYPLIYMGYNAPSIKNMSDAKEAYALMVLAQVIDGGKSSRFESNLIRNKKIAASSYISYSPFKYYDSLFLISVMPGKDKNLDELEEAIIKEIDKVKKSISSKELKIAKTNLIAEHTYALDTIKSQAVKLGRLSILDLPLSTFDNYPENIKKVSKDDVLAVANKYLIDNRLTVAKLMPY